LADSIPTPAAPNPDADRALPPDEGDAALRTRKLGLETQLLERQIRYWWLNLIPMLTIAGVVVTLFLGLLQINEGRRSRDDERFDKAVTRLGGLTASERLAGVAGLGLYLEPREKAQHRPALHFLINALAVEPDPTVRGELLDTLSRLTPTVISQDDLNDALERLRDRNRSLYSRQRDIFFAKLIHQTARATDPGNDETSLGQTSADDMASLRATAMAIAAMVRNGARTKDLSYIYCVACDFTGKTWDLMDPNFSKVADFAHWGAKETLELSGTDFDGAILKHSNFIGADLHDASFDGADLIQVNFAGADLSGAKLTDYRQGDYLMASMVTTGYAFQAPLPDFTCADLSRADFTGAVFLGIFGDGSNNAVYPILYRANLANAKLGKIRIFTVEIPTKYEPMPSFLPDTSLFKGFSQSGSYADINRNSSRKPVSVDEFWGSPSLRIREPVPQEDWMSLRLVFSELASARNLDQSDLPQGLKDFMSRNQKNLSNPNHPTPCTPKR
jgi:uncharacterized protein YjbI with pentapeptide repeats